MAKFKAGDRVQMTEATLHANLGGRAATGVVVRKHRDDPELIRVRRDGFKTIETWHEKAWQRVRTKPQRGARK